MHWQVLTGADAPDGTEASGASEVEEECDIMEELEEVKEEPGPKLVPEGSKKKGKEHMS